MDSSEAATRSVFDGPGRFLSTTFLIFRVSGLLHDLVSIISALFICMIDGLYLILRGDALKGSVTAVSPLNSSKKNYILIHT